MKTLITQPHPKLKRIIFSEEAISRLEIISEVDWVEERNSITSEELIPIIEKYDVVLSGWRSPKLTKEVLDRASNLKFVGHAAGTIVPFIDVSLFDRNIKIVNANKTLAASTAEGAFALIMSAAWNIPGYFNNMKKGIWSDNDSETVLGLEAQTIGLIGLGEISIRLIELMKPLHPKILVYSRYCSQEKADELGIELCFLDDLLKRSKIVSLHNTLTDKTRDMIGENELNLLPDGCLLVNTARAPIINEDALVKELKTGRISAAFDVYNEEPLDKEHELLKLDNVVCTPHMLGFSSYWKSRLGLTVIEDLERFIEGKELEGEITKEQYLRQTPK